MGWIKRQQAKFDAQPRQTERSYVSGESHFFFGQRYRLNLIDGAPAGRVHIRNSRTLDLYVRSGSDQATRDRIFQDWYRRELRARTAPLMATWAHAFGVDQEDRIVAIDLCHGGRAKRLALFHHEPVYSDADIARMHAESVRYEELTREHAPLEVLCAYDGLEVSL